MYFPWELRGQSVVILNKIIQIGIHQIVRMSTIRGDNDQGNIECYTRIRYI